MQNHDDPRQMAALDALIRRVEQFDALNAVEQKKVRESILLWLMRDRATLAHETKAEEETREAAHTHILGWCQTDDYAYKDWK